MLMPSTIFTKLHIYKLGAPDIFDRMLTGNIRQIIQQCQSIDETFFFLNIYLLRIVFILQTNNTRQHNKAHIMQFALTYSTYNRCPCHSRQCVTVIKITSANLHCLKGRTKWKWKKKKVLNPFYHLTDHQHPCCYSQGNCKKCSIFPKTCQVYFLLCNLSFLKLSKKSFPSTIVMWHKVYQISMIELYIVWLPENKYSVET